MKKFLKKVTLFLSTLLILVFLSYVVIAQYYEFLPSDMYFFKEFNQMYSNAKVDLLALGNSKLVSSIDKGILEKNLNVKALNLAYSSANISISKLTLESYLNKNTNLPKIILLEVSWFTFNTKRTTFQLIGGELMLNDFRLLHYAPKYGNLAYDAIKQAIKNQIYSIWRTKKNVDFSSRFKIPSPNEKDYTFTLTDFEKVFPDHIAGVDSILLNDFYSLVDICIKNNIKLILYTAPEDEDYSDSQMDQQKIKSIYLELVSKYPQNIIYLDYTKGGKFYDKQYELWLRNSHHINEIDLFTEQLTQDILNYSSISQK